MSDRTVAFLAAGGVVVGFYLVARRIGGSLVRGADGRPSTSKAQWCIWTAVVIFGYLAVFFERWRRGSIDVPVQVPENLLIAMGFSAATMALAKNVTASYYEQGLIDKELETQPPKRDPKNPPKRLPGGLLTDDQGVSDLSKIQMLSFTLIGVFMYVVRLAKQDSSALPQLMDIDPALMTLMGLSQGGYLAQKIVTKSVKKSATDDATDGAAVRSGATGPEVVTLAKPFSGTPPQVVAPGATTATPTPATPTATPDGASADPAEPAPPPA